MSSTRKQHLLMVLAAIASLLVSGAVAVGQARKQAPIVASKLNLTMEQRHVIKEIIKGLKVENEPKNIPIKLGQVTPRTVLLRAMPLEIAQKVPQIKSHLFFVKNEQFVLVDAKDNKVVDVIDLK